MRFWMGLVTGGVAIALLLGTCGGPSCQYIGLRLGFAVICR